MPFPGMVAGGEGQYGRTTIREGASDGKNRNCGGGCADDPYAIVSALIVYHSIGNRYFRRVKYQIVRMNCFTPQISFGIMRTS